MIGRLGNLVLAAGLAAALSTLAGCVTLKDYGFGTCTEYTPICQHQICERDIRGCEVCTCAEDNTRDNDLLKPFPRSPRDP